MEQVLDKSIWWILDILDCVNEIEDARLEFEAGIHGIKLKPQGDPDDPECAPKSFGTGGFRDG